ncbi:hypothetical protein ACTXT7_001195 [Hymenolepis weldensis]
MANVRIDYCVTGGELCGTSHDDSSVYSALTSTKWLIRKTKSDRPSKLFSALSIKYAVLIGNKI